MNSGLTIGRYWLTDWLMDRWMAGLFFDKLTFVITSTKETLPNWVVVHVPKREKSRKRACMLVPSWNVTIASWRPNTVYHAQRARFVPFLLVSLPSLQGKVRSLRNHEERYETHALGIARFVLSLVLSLPKLQGKIRSLRNLRSLRNHEERYDSRALGIARFVPFLVLSLPKLRGKVRSLRNSEKPVGIGFGKTVIWHSISNVHKRIIVMNSLDTRFSRNVFEAFKRTRSTCFIGSKTNRLRLVVLNPDKTLLLVF